MKTANSILFSALILLVCSHTNAQDKKSVKSSGKTKATAVKKPAVPAKSVVVADTSKLYREQEKAKEIDLKPVSPTSPSPNNPNPHDARPNPVNPAPSSKPVPSAPAPVIPPKDQTR